MHCAGELNCRKVAKSDHIFQVCISLLQGVCVNKASILVVLVHACMEMVHVKMHQGIEVLASNPGFQFASINSLGMERGDEAIEVSHVNKYNFQKNFGSSLQKENIQTNKQTK